MTDKDRIADLVEENRQLRELLLQAPMWPREWRLTPRLMRLLSALYSAKGRFVSREFLERAVWEGETFYDDNDKNLNVAIYHLRLRTEPLGVKVENWKGVGWALRGENRERLTSLLGQ